MNEQATTRIIDVRVSMGDAERLRRLSLESWASCTKFGNLTVCRAGTVAMAGCCISQPPGVELLIAQFSGDHPLLAVHWDSEEVLAQGSGQGSTCRTFCKTYRLVPHPHISSGHCGQQALDVRDCIAKLEEAPSKTGLFAHNRQLSPNRIQVFLGTQERPGHYLGQSIAAALGLQEQQAQRAGKPAHLYYRAA